MPSIQQGRQAIPLPSAELNLGGTSTSETLFKTASAQNGVAAASTLTCYVPGTNVMKNRPFEVRVGGRVTAGASITSFTGSLYWGTSSTISSNVKVATGSAGFAAAASATWQIIFEGTWDSTSSQIVGIQRGYVNGVIIAIAKLTTSTSAVDLSGESTSNGFTVTGTFSAGSATNSAVVDYFEVLTL